MRILLLTPFDEEEERRLREVVPENVILTRDRNDIAPVTAVIGGPPPELVQYMRRLEWVQFRSDSLERWAPTLRVLAARRVTVTRTRGSYNATVPDHAMMLLLALARDVPQLLRQAQARRWEPGALRTVVLAGATVAVVGMGSIGAEVARRALAFGLRVLGVDPQPENVPDGVESVVSPEDLRDVMAEADFVVVTVPHTPLTVGMIGAAELARMKPTAYLINVGRGVAVDTDALVAALDQNRIAGAALDVVEPWPLPDGHPLYEHPRVLLTGHSAPVGSDGAAAQFEIILENVRRYVNGEPLCCRVDLDEWV